MLPGWPFDSTIFTKVMALGNCHAIAIDYPGWGSSNTLDQPLNYNVLSDVIDKFSNKLGETRERVVIT